MRKTETPGKGDSRVVRHAVRTFLNHVTGYGEVLREESEAELRPDLAEGYGKIVRDGGALREFILPCFRKRDEGGPGPAERAELVHEAYGLLYDIIAQVKALQKRIGTDSRFASDTGIILDAAHSIVGLLEGWMAGEGEEARPERPEASNPIPAARTGRILVVDDSPFNRDLLARHLEHQGHQVETAADGESALQRMATARFDIVILDVMLPGMNGYELIERIRREEGPDSLYVLVVSAFDDTESVARCIQLGAEDYLPRDFEPVILRARIESCLEKKRLREKEALYMVAVTETERRLRTELQEGAAYVRSLLPSRLSGPALRSDWVFIPSLSLGGDVFGYHPIGNGPVTGPLALYLIDVSGHGIEAALYSVTLMNVLKSQVLPGTDFGDPSSVLSRLNESFRMEEQNNLYFSAWYGVWDSARRELVHASAGSPPALLRNASGALLPLASGGPIVGAFDDAAFPSLVESIEDGSVLYLFSDGAFEIGLRGGGILGLEGFGATLAEASALPEGTSLPGLVARLKALSASGRFEDDLSILEFRFG